MIMIMTIIIVILINTANNNDDDHYDDDDVQFVEHKLLQIVVAIPFFGRAQM